MKKILTPLALLCAIVLVGAGCDQTATTNTNNGNENYTVEVTPINKDDFMAEQEAMAEGEEAMDSEDTMMEEESHTDDAIDGEETTGEVMEKDDDTAMDATATEESEQDNAVMEKDTSEEETVEEEEEQAAAPGVYTDYDASQVAGAAANGDAVLFFHASWCPTCKALDNNIESSDIPDGLTIFKVNYDKENDLRKKYGVTYQHTLVQVDSSGELITKWSGGNTLNSIVSKVQ